MNWFSSSSAEITMKPTKPKTSNDLSWVWNECTYMRRVLIHPRFTFKSNSISLIFTFFIIRRCHYQLFAYNKILETNILNAHKDNSRAREKDAWLFVIIIVIIAIGFRTTKSIIIIESISKIVCDGKNHKKSIWMKNKMKRKIWNWIQCWATIWCWKKTGKKYLINGTGN